MTEEALRKIAADAVDRSHLLAGEDPDTLQPHDAEHWVQVYSELLAFKRGLLSTAKQLADTAEATARQEIAASDLPVLDAQATKLTERLEFWRRRKEELRRDASILQG